MEFQMPLKKRFTSKPNFQQEKGGKLNTRLHLRRKTLEIHKFSIGIA
jgi:hypothetical protein